MSVFIVFTVSFIIILFRLDPDEVVTGCFDFRTRTRSFDLHQLGGSRLKKKFTHLFHSSSDGSIKPTSISSAPATPLKGQSPRCSPQRRRLVRVVRDVEPEECGEENPHVVHKYSEAYLRSKQARQRYNLLVKEIFFYLDDFELFMLISILSSELKGQ